jgi:hypothetical protein
MIWEKIALGSIAVAVVAVALTLAQSKRQSSLIYLVNKTELPIEYQLSWMSSYTPAEGPFHHLSFPAETQSINLSQPAGKRLVISPDKATLTATATYRLKEPHQQCFQTDQGEDCHKLADETTQVSITPLHPGTTYFFELEDLVQEHKKLVFRQHANSKKKHEQL